MRVEVQAVHQVTDELVAAVGRLLPQLSGSAAALDADDLTRIVGHQAISLFVARGERGIIGMLTLVTYSLPSRASRVEANRLYQQLGFQLRDSNVYRYRPG